MCVCVCACVHTYIRPIIDTRGHGETVIRVWSERLLAVRLHTMKRHRERVREREREREREKEREGGGERINVRA